MAIQTEYIKNAVSPLQALLARDDVTNRSASFLLKTENAVDREIRRRSRARRNAWNLAFAA